jgi:choline kinase
MVLQVLLLAAGQATRLRPLTDDRPKCLLEVGGRPIVSRAVAQLLSRGLRQITIVDGYRGDMIRATLAAEFPDVDFRFIRNEDYATTNNAWSMHLAETLPPGPLMLLDSDIVFDTGVLDLLLAHPAPSRLALRTRGEIGHEEMKVVLDGDGLVRALGKELTPGRRGRRIGRDRGLRGRFRRRTLARPSPSSPRGTARGGILRRRFPRADRGRLAGGRRGYRCPGLPRDRYGRRPGSCPHGVQ